MFGGTVRGRTTSLRLPAETDLEAHKRWAGDMRVRRAGPIGRWHEPAATATWKERWTEEAKDKSSVLWSIAASDATVGFIRIRFEGAPHAETIGLNQFVIDPDQERKGYGWDAALTLHRWIVGNGGVSLRAPTLDDAKQFPRWMQVPEATRFWGDRVGDFRDEAAAERHKRNSEDQNSVTWSIAYEDETVGFTGLFDIDWAARDCESGIFIGRSDLYGRGIASEAVRLRTDFAWRELRLQ